MVQDDSLSPYEVFTGSSWQAALLKSILADNEIETIVNDPYRLPWITFGTVTQCARVFVAKKDYGKAILLVKQFLENLSKESGEDTTEGV